MTKFKIIQTAGDDKFRITDDPTIQGKAVQPTSGSVSIRREQYGPLFVTTLTLANVAQSITNGTEYQSTKIFTFPEGRINVLGCLATLQQKTTSAVDTTLNASSTGAIALGTAAASNVSLTGTMVDLLPSTAFTSSATINVAGTAVSAALAAAAQFDGTSTAKDMYLNTAFATTTDVDGNATQTISGTIRFTYLWLGDTPLSS
jgi:hypothetical protein